MGNHDKSQIRRLLLTCSGGPFYGMDRAQLSGMKKEDALRHPNWKMGPKITIDCATLMNKGLEIIEAMRLYDLPLEQVTALIHRQSIVHSMVEFTDGVDRQGRKGYFRSGLDAMRRSTHPLEKFETAKPLEEYRLVILGSPVWAGRCASPVRGLLKRRGQELSRVAYVLTRGGDKRYEEVYRQMDSYTAQPHLLEASLRPGSVGYVFWRDKFIQDVQRYLAEQT